MFRKIATAVVLVLTLPHTVALAGRNTNPSVNITAPAAGDTFAPPATIEISASASDADGAVTKVDFYNGNVLIGTSSTAPYSMTWSGVPLGSYSLTAKATDNGGGVGTSSAVNVTVATPKVAFTSPQAGGNYVDSVTVSGSYEGDPTKTNIWVSNGSNTRLANKNGNSFSVTMPVYVGANTIKVSVVRPDRTYDNASINVTGWRVPQVAMVAPSTTQFRTPVDIAFEAVALSELGTITKVEFFNGATLLGTASAPPYVYTWMNAPKGQYQVSARATDNANFTATASSYLTVLGPNVAPSASLISPSNNAVYVAPAVIPLQASATDSDGSIASVEFLHNEAVIGVSNVPPYQLQWSQAQTGTYTLYARATDNDGAQTLSAPVSVTVTPANVAPQVSLTSPAAGSEFTLGDSIALRASASDSDGTVSRVEFHAGAQLLGTATAAPYEYTWQDAWPGVYNVTATAFDNNGASTTTAPLTVTVKDPPPAAIVSPAADTSFEVPGAVTIAVRAFSRAATIARIELYAGGVLVASHVPTGAYNDYTYNFSWTDATAGTHTLTAQVTDSSGVTSTSDAITVKAVVPPTILFMAGGQYYVGPGYIDLFASATAVEGATISKVEYFNGTTLIATRTAPPFNITWNNVPVGTYSVTAKATDSLGVSKESAPVEIVVGFGPTITPEPSLDGSSVADDMIDIEGTFQAPPNSAVDINGTLATMTEDGKFFINNVHLAPGPNTFTLTVTTMDGQTAKRDITIVSTAVAPFTFSATEDTGRESLTPRLQLTNRGNASYTSIELSCSEGANVITVSFIADANNIVCNYDTPGTHRATVTVFDVVEEQTVVVYVATHTFHVASVRALGRTVRSVYSGMLGRLRDENTTAAEHAFTVESRDQYKEIFAMLGAGLTAAVEQMGEIRAVRISGNSAEIAVARSVDGMDEVFVLVLQEGDDGIWRIESM